MRKSLVGLVAAGLALGACGSDDDDAEVVDPAGVEQEILGTWYPWDIPGYDPGTSFDAQTFDEATIEFKDDGTWRGSDGCNGQGGDYKVGADGTFSSSEPGPQTLIGCANVPNSSVLHKSVRVEVVDGVLILTDENVKTTGRYLREPQALPSPSGAAG